MMTVKIIHGKAYYAYVACAKLLLLAGGGLMIWSASDFEDPLALLFGGIMVLVGIFSGWDDW